MFDYKFPPHWSTMRKLIYLYTILKNKKNEQQEDAEEVKNDEEL